MDFRILGPPSAWFEGSPVDVGGPRHRRLLAVLLLAADEVVPTGRLIDALWGERPPASAGAMVHVRISELRAALRLARPYPDAGIGHEAGGYTLRLGDDDLDTRRFADLATAGLAALARGEPAAARAHLEAGLALWHGPALGEFRDEAFAQDAVAELEGLRLRAFEGRLAADLALGRSSAIVGELEAAVREHPLREPLWGHLMVALYRSGRQGEALAVYDRARTHLAEQLGIDPGPALQATHRAILTQDPALAAPANPTPPGPERLPGNVSTPLTSFVGRAVEVAAALEALDESRLVSLTGVGGVGKSRLAIQVGLAARPRFPGGTWLVELAALHQPGLVVRAVAATLGVREHAQRETVELLTEHLGSAATLLVLDNCEHLVGEVADLVDRLLAACPGLRVLATSRERLGITGEVLRPVAGLPATDATRLLVERARAVEPTFALTEANTEAVAEICRQLDGLPLAIELAAARANALRMADIADRLDDRFRILGRGERTALPRHQTLRAVVDWSFDLLSPAEQHLFARLSVFIGGFTLPAAEAVGAPDAVSVADGVTRLVDKSLVVLAEHRYHLLETVRAYGIERLIEDGRAAETHERHAVYHLDLVRAARLSLLGPDQAAGLRRLEGELGNLRAALAWFIGHGDAARALRLAGWLYPLWDRHGHYREGRRWLAQALALNADVDTAARARALDSAAGLALIQGDHVRAGAEAEQAAALSRRAGDRAGLAQALTTRGLAAVYAGDSEQATAVLTEALGVAREVGDRFAEGSSMVYLMTASLARDAARTRELGDETEALLERLGDPEGLAWARVLRGAGAWRQGDHASAIASLRPGLLGFADLGHVVGLSVGLYLCGQLATATDWAEGIGLLAASEALRESVGAALLPFAREWLDVTLARATAVVGPADVERLWRVGAAWPGPEAVDRATAWLTRPTRAPS